LRISIFKPETISIILLAHYPAVSAVLINE